MTKRLAAPVLAAALALAGLAAPTPARAADAEDLARALFGAATLFVIVKSLDDNDGRKRQAAHGATPRYQPHYVPPRHDRHRAERRHEPPRVDRCRADPPRRIDPPCHEHRKPVAVPSKPRYPAKAIPASCIQRFDTRDGGRNLVTRQCLDRAGVSRGLPERCEVVLRTNHGKRLTYGARCLENAGYRFKAGHL